MTLQKNSVFSMQKPREEAKTMTEWEKKEEQHCQALEEAEKILKDIARELDVSASHNLALRKRCYAWLKKWCEEE